MNNFLEEVIFDQDISDFMAQLVRNYKKHQEQPLDRFYEYVNLLSPIPLSQVQEVIVSKKTCDQLYDVSLDHFIINEAEIYTQEALEKQHGWYWLNYGPVSVDEEWIKDNRAYIRKIKAGKLK